MIEIYVKTDGKDVMDRIYAKACTLEEAALTIFRLEEIKLNLLNKEFESKFEVEEDEEVEK